LAAVALALLLGCASQAGTAAAQTAASPEEWNKIVLEAKREGKVVLWSSKSESLMERILEAFKRKYPGIQTSFLRIQGPPAATRINEELAANRKLTADVIINVENVWLAGHAKEGNLQPLVGPSVANYPRDAIKNGAPILGYDPILIMYNTDQIKVPPADWDTLLEDKYRGRVGIVSDTLTVFKIHWAFLEKKMGTDYLKKLGALAPVIANSATSTTQAIAAGELLWAPYAQSYLVEDLKKQGAPVDYALPKSGTHAIVQYGASFKQSTNPNAGRVLLDFLMSREGQAIINGGNGGVSPYKDIPGTLTYDMSKIEILDASKYTAEDLAAASRMFNSTFRR